MKPPSPTPAFSSHSSVAGRKSRGGIGSSTATFGFQYIGGGKAGRASGGRNGAGRRLAVWTAAIWVCGPTGCTYIGFGPPFGAGADSTGSATGLGADPLGSIFSG